MVFVDTAVIVLAFVVGFYFYGLVIKDNSIIDIGWGLGFVLVAYYTFMMYSDFSVRQSVLTFLVSMWGGRLAGHILLRHNGEDSRYAKWRDEWKFFNVRAFFQIFLLQGFLMYVIVLPIIFVNTSLNYGFELLDFLGLAVFLIGFAIEVVADFQLMYFVKYKKSKVNRFIKSGLWRYSRHPNYFGEALLWWGIFLIAYSGTGVWWLVVSPLIVTVLVRFVSGVPILERKYMKDPEFRKYARQTNVFVPWRVRW